MNRPGIAIRVVLLLLSSGTLSCSHIAHRANVREGINMSLMGASSWEAYDPPNKDYYRRQDPDVDFLESGWTDYQFSAGYAWQLRNKRKLMPYVSFGVIEDGFPIPSASLYYQATSEDSPSSAGIGLTIGVDPLLYLMWGRDFVKNSKGRGKLGMDLASGFGSGPAILVDSRIFYQLDLLSFGLFAEYRYFPGVLETCVENCDYTNYVKSRLSFGIILIHAPGKHRVESSD
jgi:hypothetical protein